MARILRSVESMEVDALILCRSSSGKRRRRKHVRMSVRGGEKLPVSRGAGLTAKGRRKYNRATGSKLRPPAPHPKTKRDKARRKSFCARSRSWKGVRGKAARRRWNC